MQGNRAVGPVSDSRRRGDFSMADPATDSGDSPEVVDLRTITPHLPRHILHKLSAFIEIRRSDGREDLANALRRLHELWQDETWSLGLRAVALVLADLIDQGWDVNAEATAIHLQPPGLRL